MRIFLYDNDEDNFRGMKPEVECVYVDSTEPNPLVADPTDPYGYYRGFARKYPRNAYIRFIRSSQITGLGIQEPPPGNGITEAMMNSLLRIASRDPGDDKIVFFDWDGTIIVTEGMNPFSENEVGREVLEGQLAFLMGGPERLRQVRRLFRLLHELSVDVYILTNNQMFLQPGLREVFYGYIRVLTPYIPQDHIFGSVSVIHTTRRSNKALYLSHREKFWKKEKIIPLSSFRVSDRILRDHLDATRPDEIMVQSFRIRPAETVQTVLDRDSTINDLKKKNGLRGVYYYDGKKIGGRQRIRDVTDHVSPVFVVKKK